MSISKFLSKAIGIYFLIISTGMLLNMPQIIDSIHALITNQPSLFIVGFITLIIGILMVVAHNIWQWHWRVIVTLIAWLTLIKGVVLLFYPELTQNMIQFYVDDMTFAYGGAALDFLLGLVLVYFGFKKH